MTETNKKTNGKAEKSKSQKRAERFNTWTNILTSQGTKYDQRTQGDFEIGNVALDDSRLESLYHNYDLAKTIVERIVEDALRNDPEFIVVDPNASDEDVLVAGEDKVNSQIIERWEIISKTMDASIWGRLYGCGGIFLGVDDGKDLSEPLETPIREGSLKWIEVVDKRNLSPALFYEADDPMGRTGEVKTWQISTSDSNLNAVGIDEQVHESRLIMFPGTRTSNRVKAGNGHCDLSVLQDVYDVLRDFDATQFAANTLVQNASQGVYKIKELADLMATDKNALEERLRVIDISRGVGRSLILDAEEEDFQQIGAQNLQGITAIVEQMQLRVAAAANMPVTILMGRSPAGMNATGESDARNWFNQVETYQKDVLAPRLSKLLKIILQSGGQIRPDQEVKVSFPSLWETPETEKMSNLLSKAQAATSLVSAGILTAEEVREWFISD